MQLTLQTQMMGNVAIIRCQGRLVTGDEAFSLQQEIERLMPATNRIVLQLAEVNFIDSGSLGAILRLYALLQKNGGKLMLCQVSPFVLQVLRSTHLDRLFHPYDSDREAIIACSMRGPLPGEALRPSGKKAVCIDPSSDLLAYLRALLQRSGFDVFTTRHSTDASIFIAATKPSVVILGPGTHGMTAAIEEVRGSSTHIPIVMLPADFATTEASQAGTDLVDRIQSLLDAPK
jgi:anti-anti-sigma factor